MASSEPELNDADLPATFRALDAASAGHQRLAATLTKGQLACLLIAALGGALDLSVAHRKVNLGGLLALAGFAGAAAIALISRAQDAEGKWYRTRAAAESFKTLSWRYAVGGEPFAVEVSDAEQTLSGRFLEILGSLHSGDLAPSPPGDEVTPAMRSLRSSTLGVRHSTYLIARIGNQEAWYFSKSSGAAKSARLWNLITGLSAIAGFGLGIFRLLDVVELDLLGLVATGIGGVAAWTQFRQHRVLAASYSVAQQELSVIRLTAETVTAEETWTTFVRDAEDAISREHTLWLARRGATPPKP